MAKESQTKAKSTSKSRKRLGRGLSSLIAAGEDAETIASPPGKQDPSYVAETKTAKSAGKSDGTPRRIPVENIAPNPYQPRKEFDDAHLAELAASIRAQGVLQPLVVSTDEASDDTYLLIAGERRLRAAKLAGLETVPCVVRQATDQQRVEWALVENIQRTDLNPMEKARAYRAYIDRFELSQAQAAQRLGQARATVANFLRLMELPKDVQQLVAEELLTFGHAKILAGLDTPGRQQKLAARCVKEQLSVRKLEELVARSEEENAAPSRSDNKAKTKPPYVQDLEERFRHAVGTRVSIQPGRSKHSGKIVIEYYSFDDFDRIAASLGVASEA